MNENLHLVCPLCHAVNRMPKGKLGQNPKCGSCHNSLFDGHPLDLSASSFTKHISNNDIPVLVDFWAPWCGPCKVMAPAFAQAASILEPNYRLAKVNTEVEQSIANQLAIRSIPTLVLFVSGREVARQAGAMNAQDIVRWVKSHT